MKNFYEELTSIADCKVSVSVGVSVQLLHEDALVPTQSTPGSSGYDLYALEDVELMPEETKLIPTGIAMAIPRGFELQIRPRSGMSLKTELVIKNAPGTIDSDYVGEIMIIAKNGKSASNGTHDQLHKIHIKKGDRIAQGVFTPVYKAEFNIVESLDNTDRGNGGFGSTGA